MSKLIAAIAAVVATLYAATAAAQSAEPEVATIIVTAEKRAQDAQTVPIAVAGISGETLERSGISNSRDLELAVPSLNYATNAGYAQPFLRGIGSDITNPGAESSVATYLDGVYVSATQGQMLNLLGVSRVEVLAGPQGTLYGRNASGGAINIYSVTPKPELESKASLSYGNYNQILGMASVSGALTPAIDAGLYVAASRRDVFYDYVAPRAPGQPLSDDAQGARLKAVWRVTDAVKLTGSLEFSHELVGDSAFRNIQPDALGYNAAFLGSAAATPIIANYQYATSNAQFQRTKSTTGILREEFDLGFADLVGVTGLRNTRSHIRTDLDGTAAPLVTAASPETSRQYSQEIQLLSRPDSAIQWIGGVYYFYEKGAFPPLYVISPILFQPATFTTIASYVRETTASYAAFAQARLPLNFVADGLYVTLGGRYTRDRRAKLDAPQFYLNDAGVEQLPGVTFPGAHQSYNNFSPKATLGYQLPNALIYATYAQGFKSGQYNLTLVNLNNSVLPEKLTDYEVGIKSNWLNSRLQLNLAGYWYQFHNLQVQALDPAGGVSSIFRNAGSARAYGLEFTTAAAVTDRLTINLAGAWEDSKYTSFDNAPFWIYSPFGNTEVLGHSAAGQPLQHAPKFVETLSANYSVPMPRESRLDFNGSVYHSSNFSWDPVGQLREPEYTLVNASAAYTLPGGRFALRLWANNLTDKHKFTFAAISAFGVYAQDDAPRTYGATVSWQLGGI